MTPEQAGYYLGIKFQGSEKSYYFSCPTNDFALGDLVIVLTSAGVEAGTVSMLPAPLSKYNSSLELKSILRKADERDIRDYQQNLEDAKRAHAITRKEIEALSLSMDLIDAFYTIDGSKVTITYTSTEKRVDFRELLKVLAPQLGCRIELRQIASRDKAKMIGGLGICGLPLCCSTFLTQFEGISIQRAKNQMLTLNIPKLSGPCGKLICCLTYEDDAYTAAKKEFPRIGSPVKIDGEQYTVDGFNILSRTVRVVNAGRSDYKTFSLEDYNAVLNGTYVHKVEIIKSDDSSLPSFGIEPHAERKEKTNNSENQNSKNNGKSRPNHQKPQQNNQNRNPQQKPHQNNNRPQKGPQNGPQQQKGPQNGNNQPRRPQQGHRPQQGGNRPQNNNPQQGQNQGNPNPNQNRNRHRHHHRGGSGNRGGEEGGAQ